ncbi:MAG: peptidase U32 family protein [Erysipelotrichaceae bacterium]
MRLLSILRSIEHMQALKDAGVDGIVFGIEGFSYRSPLYDLEQIKEVVDRAKSLGVSTYLHCNRMLDEEEIIPALTLIQTIDALGVDGILFQDLAYVNLCEQIDAKLIRIYAPEAILTSSPEVRTMLENGVDHVMVAKELTLDEVLKIAGENPKKVGVFGFGHLPMSVSRRPLVKNYLDEIKKDSSLADGFGLRLQEEKRAFLYPILEEDKETTIFQDRLFCVLPELTTLQANDVAFVLADDVFVEEGMLTAFIHSAHNRMAQREDDFMERYAHGLTSGYFYKKTNLTKEGN